MATSQSVRSYTFCSSCIDPVLRMYACLKIFCPKVSRPHALLVIVPTYVPMTLIHWIKKGCLHYVITIPFSVPQPRTRASSQKIAILRSLVRVISLDSTGGR